jgi:predicted nucleotidyltransferase
VYQVIRTSIEPMKNVARMWCGGAGSLEAIAPVFAGTPGVQLVVVFGSRARAEGTRASDLDVGVLTDQPVDLASLRAFLAAVADAAGLYQRLAREITPGLVSPGRARREARSGSGIR